MIPHSILNELNSTKYISSTCCKWKKIGNWKQPHKYLMPVEYSRCLYQSETANVRYKIARATQNRLIIDGAEAVLGERSPAEVQMELL